MLNRALLGLAIVAVQLAAEQDACCRPPDEVSHSLIPPLKQASQQRSSGVGRIGHLLPGRSLGQTWSPIPSPAITSDYGAVIRPSTSSPLQRATSYPTAEGNGTADLTAEQLEIWNSTEMRMARDAVIEFCRRSAQTSLAEGKAFLTRLSQLSPKEIQQWLERFQGRRVHASHGREMEALARRVTVEHTIRRQEAIRRTAHNIADQRRLATESARGEYPTAQQLEAAGYSRYGSLGSFGLSVSYDPMSPEFDPSSPRGYARRVAAAMSLPGDLPRSDPRNFLRGDEGTDLGEQAISRDAPPPAAPVAPTVDPATDE